MAASPQNEHVAGPPAEAHGCHVVQLLRVPIRSLNVARWAACDAYCPTLNALRDELDALVEKYRPNSHRDRAAWWGFVERHGLPGLAFVELDRRMEFEPAAPLQVSIEPVPLSGGHPTIAMLGGPTPRRRVDLAAIARIVVIAFVMSASLVLAAGVGAHLELLTVMLGCAAVVLLMRWRRREQGPLRWYLVPGGVDVVIQHRLTQVRVERFRPRDTLLYVAQTPKGWKVTLMPRESGDVTSTGLTLQQAQALLAAWQSPLEPLPLERCEIYGC